MNKIARILIVSFLILGFAKPLFAMQINLQPTEAQILQMEDVTKKVFNKTITLKPNDAVTVLEYFYASIIKGKQIDHVILEELLGHGLGETAAKQLRDITKITPEKILTDLAGKLIDAAIEVMSENFEKSSGIDKYQFELLMKSVKNLILNGGNPAKTIYGEVKDVTSIIHDSWKETVQALKNLPPGTPMDESLGIYYKLYVFSEEMKKNKNYIGWVVSQVAVGGFAFVDGINIIGKYLGNKLYDSGLYNAIIGINGDASKISQRNAQQQLTAVKYDFTENFTGTMSQTIGEAGHSSTPFVGTFLGIGTGVLTERFIGQFKGVNTYVSPLHANPLYMNIGFTGSMSGTVKGFNGGDLKGSVNAVINDAIGPANVFSYSGNVTIKPNGELTGNLVPPQGQPLNNFQSRHCSICPGNVGTSIIEWKQLPIPR